MSTPSSFYFPPFVFSFTKIKPEIKNKFKNKWKMSFLPPTNLPKHPQSPTSPKTNLEKLKIVKPKTIKIKPNKA
jgi:hypothetical protein